LSGFLSHFAGLGQRVEVLCEPDHIPAIFLGMVAGNELVVLGIVLQRVLGTDRDGDEPETSGMADCRRPDRMAVAAD
jgi:hypothetical protein